MLDDGHMLLEVHCLLYGMLLTGCHAGLRLVTGAGIGYMACVYLDVLWALHGNPSIWRSWACHYLGAYIIC